MNRSDSDNHSEDEIDKPLHFDYFWVEWLNYKKAVLFPSRYKISAAVAEILRKKLKIIFQQKELKFDTEGQQYMRNRFSLNKFLWSELYKFIVLDLQTDY